MKKIHQLIFLLLILVFIMPGCTKSFSDLNQNPNKPTSVPASLLFNGVLNSLYDPVYTENEKWCQYFLWNYDYYGNNRYDFGSGTDYFATLTNTNQMIQEAAKQGLPTVNPYEALAKFFKAYFFTKMSLEMGDIPMNQALQGAKNLTPVYDPQKVVFQNAFLWLDSANSDLASLISSSDNSLQGDIYYNNDLTKWQKAVNSFRLRLLVHLSKQAADADLGVAQQFSKILGNKSSYPIFEDGKDNLQYNFIYPTNTYPQNPGIFGFNALRENTSATYVSLLTQYQDPRVYITCEPATYLVLHEGKNPTGFDAFVGADPGEDLGQMYIEAGNGQYSLINRKHYYDSYTGEPSIQIGYPEQCFNIAEAINRGWIASGPLGDAEAYYKAGILASWSFYSIPVTGPMTVYFLHPGASLGVYDTYNVNVDFDTYYNQASVKYAGNNATGLTQILSQRYIALFRHSGLESYYTYRRTGVPNFTTGPGTGNSGRIAWRFQYPSIEKTANVTNYDAALQSQFGGTDDINGVMWLVK
jgi:hypothetical protein